MKHAILTSAVAVVALGITWFAAYRTYFPTMPETVLIPSPVVFQPTIPVATSDDPKLGSFAPKHTIIMFGDFQCAACGEVAGELKTVLRNHPDAQLVWKDAPNIMLHPWSASAAAAGRCAGQQNKFWEMHDALFSTPITDEASIVPVANNLGLDRVSFEACLLSDSTRKRISSAVLLAETYGVTATPYFFINSKAVGVLNTVEEFEQFLK